MAQVSTALEKADAAAVTRRQRLAEFWFYFSENKGAVIGLWVFAALVVVAVLAGVIAPHPPNVQFRESVLVPPFWQSGGSMMFLACESRAPTSQERRQPVCGT